MSQKKQRRKYVDFSLIAIVIFITVFGLVMIYSSSSYSAQISQGDPAYFLKNQLKYALFGFVLMMITAHFPRKYYPLVCYPAYIAALLLMVAVQLFGVEINGQKRWLNVFGMQFQPVEIAKAALILFLSLYICALGDELHTPLGVCKCIAWSLPLIFLVFINSLSGAVILVMITLIMVTVASRSGLGGILLSIVAVLAVAVNLFKPWLGPIIASACEALVRQGASSYRLNRILVWTDPENYPYDGGYQVLQGLYAIGSGGLTGKGLGESIQKLGFIPEAENDMIFAIICEELGLLGAVSLLLLFMFLLYRCYVIARASKDLFCAMMVTGVMAHILVQLIFNIGVVCNVFPNTGVTMPFISYGGTSVAMMMAEIGFVLSAARNLSVGNDYGRQ